MSLMSGFEILVKGITSQDSIVLTKFSWDSLRRKIRFSHVVQRALLEGGLKGDRPNRVEKGR